MKKRNKAKMLRANHVLTRNELIVLLLILALSAGLRFYPAVINDFPKGSDSFFHIRTASEIKNSGSLFLYDPLTDTVSQYPPLFHLVLAVLFYLGDAFTIARFIGPLLGVLSLAVFFLFLLRIAGTRIALASAFVYGITADAISKAVITTPENLGLLLIFSALYFFDKYLKEKSPRPLYISVISTSLLALTHTLSFLMLLVFLLAFFGFEKKIIRLILIPIIVSLAWLAYTAILGATNSLVFYFPAGTNYVFASASVAVFALAILGAKGVLNFRLVIPAYLLLLFWSLFVPAYPERAFTFSVVLLSVIAGFGINEITKLKGYGRVFVLAFLVIIALAHAVEIQNPFGYARTELTKQDYAVLEWAEENLPSGSVIASTWQVSGVWVQTIAERKTILGAFHESVPDYQQRRRDLYLMFTSASKGTIKNVAAKYNASYIFINSYEEGALYQGASNRLRGMFQVVKENEYTHLFKIQ